MSTLAMRLPVSPPRWRYRTLLAAGVLALPLMLVLAATQGEMAVSFITAGHS